MVWVVRRTYDTWYPQISVLCTSLVYGFVYIRRTIYVELICCFCCLSCVSYRNDYRFRSDRHLKPRYPTNDTKTIRYGSASQYFGSSISSICIFLVPFLFCVRSYSSFLSSLQVVWCACSPPSYSLRSAQPPVVFAMGNVYLCFIVCDHRARLTRRRRLGR